MPNDKIIINGEVQPNEWQLIQTSESGETSLPEAGNIIVPLKIWQEQATQLSNHPDKVGVWLNSDEEPEQLSDALDNLPLIAINFPVFGDGRGYSYARVLRERYQYQGEIRAIGDVAQDQLFYLRRCGFDSFALKEGKDVNEATNGLETIFQTYQAAVDQPEPLFRRR